MTFVLDPHYTGQYLMPILDMCYTMFHGEEYLKVDLNKWPFSPDNENWKYFLQYVKVQRVEDWRESGGTYFANKYGDKDGEGHEYIGTLYSLVGSDEEDLVGIEEKMERARRGDFNEDGVVGYCDLLIFDRDGNLIRYAET